MGSSGRTSRKMIVPSSLAAMSQRAVTVGQSCHCSPAHHRGQRLTPIAGCAADGWPLMPSPAAPPIPSPRACLQLDDSGSCRRHIPSPTCACARGALERLWQSEWLSGVGCRRFVAALSVGENENGSGETKQSKAIPRHPAVEGNSKAPSSRRRFQGTQQSKAIRV